MRFFVVLLALLALPVLVLAHRHLYFLDEEPRLHAQIQEGLNKAGLTEVKVTVDYLDVILTGRVPSMAARDEARAIADKVPGVRTRPQDNRLQVKARVDGRWEGTHYVLSGWLRDERTLRELTSWLAAGRPGLDVVADEVRISSHVIPEAPPKEGEVPKLFQPLWMAIEMPASLTILKEGNEVRAIGHLPDEDFRSRVLQAIGEANATLVVKSEKLAAGNYVRAEGFVNEDVLVDFLRSFYASPEPGVFEADGKAIHVSGNVTKAMQREWEPMLALLDADAKLHTRFAMFPSIYHLPGFKPVSMVSADIMGALTMVLKDCAVTFETGETSLPDAGLPKVETAARALINAGPEAKVVVGCRAEATGNEETDLARARRRAESVARKLEEFGVPEANVEVVEFGPGDAPETAFGGRAEIMLR